MTSKQPEDESLRTHRQPGESKAGGRDNSRFPAH